MMRRMMVASISPSDNGRQSSRAVGSLKSRGPVLTGRVGAGPPDVGNLVTVGIGTSVAASRVGVDVGGNEVGVEVGGGVSGGGKGDGVTGTGLEGGI